MKVRKKPIYSPKLDKRQFYVIFILFIFLIAINPSLFPIYWPYLIMSIIILIALNIKDKKLLTFFIGISMLLIFGLIFWFYYVFPIAGNYVTIPTSGSGTIFNAQGGKFSIGYYPDYLKSGDNVILTVDVCTAENTCVKCEDCVLDGYFINEENRIQYLFRNESLRNKENTQFLFTGHKTEILMTYKNSSTKFYIPQPSLYQAVFVALEQNPILGTLSLLAFLGAILGSLYKVIKFLRKFIFNKEPKKYTYDRKVLFI